MSERPISACDYPWEWAHVTATGDVRPCCFAIRPVGNVLEAGSFENVWNGPVMRDLRRSIRSGWVHPICRGAGCSFARDTERALDLASYDLDVSPGTVIPFGGGSPHLLMGWAWPEAWGVWSDGSVSQLAMRLSEPVRGDLELCVHACAFLPTAQSEVRVGVRANGTLLGTWRFRRADGQCFSATSSAFGGRIERRIVVPRSCLENEAGLLVVDFLVDSPRAPIDCGLGTDDRRLGLGLLYLWLTPATRRRRIKRVLRAVVGGARGVRYAEKPVASPTSLPREP